MTNYIIQFDRNTRQWKLMRDGFLRMKTLTTGDYKGCIEYAKNVAAKTINRPSKVSIIDANGNMTFTWDYKRQRGKGRRAH